MPDKKIHFLLNSNSRVGICGLKHANKTTTDVNIFIRHSSKCEKCFADISKFIKQLKPNE